MHRFVLVRIDRTLLDVCQALRRGTIAENVGIAADCSSHACELRLSRCRHDAARLVLELEVARQVEVDRPGLGLAEQLLVCHQRAALLASPGADRLAAVAAVLGSRLVEVALPGADGVDLGGRERVLLFEETILGSGETALRHTLVALRQQPVLAEEVEELGAAAQLDDPLVGDPHDVRPGPPPKVEV